MSTDRPKRCGSPPQNTTAARKRAHHNGTMDSSNKTSTEAIASTSSSDFSIEGTTTLVVGSGQQKMLAYSSHLVQNSQFFAAAMKKEWVEGQTRTIKLPEETPTVMAKYLAYLCSGKLFTEDITSTLGDNKDDTTACFRLLASLYVSGERFLNRSLQNAVLKEFIRLTRIPDKSLTHWCPTGDSVNIIYRGTPQGSPGRRLMVDLHATAGNKEWLDHKLEAEFVTDVAKALYDKVKRSPYRGIDLKIEEYMSTV